MSNLTIITIADLAGVAGKPTDAGIQVRWQEDGPDEPVILSIATTDAHGAALDFKPLLDADDDMYWRVIAYCLADRDRDSKARAEQEEVDRMRDRLLDRG